MFMLRFLVAVPLIVLGGAFARDPLTAQATPITSPPDAFEPPSAPPLASRVPVKSIRVDDLSKADRIARTLTASKPPRKGCSFADRQLRADTIFDMDGLYAALDSLGQPAAGSVLLSMQVGRKGIRVNHVIEKSVADEAADSVAALVVQHARVRTDTAGGSFRLLVAAAGEPERVRIAPVVSCAPVLTSRTKVSAALQSAVRGLMKTYVFTRPVVTVVWAQVGTDGSVTRMRVQTTSGSPQADSAAVAAFTRTARFDPAIIDGSPLEVWVQVPLVMSVQR